MSLLKDLFDFIIGAENRKARAEERRARAEETRIINMGWRELYDEYRIRIKEKEDRIKELQSMKGNLSSQSERDSMLQDEQSFHLEYIKLLMEHRDALEELYFLRHEVKNRKEKLG